MRVAVITISDRASRGDYEDLTGPEIARTIRETFADAEVMRRLVPDDQAAITAALRDCAAGAAPADFILTTGGTGISPRDVTPEATRAFCDRELPGIAEILRAESYRETPRAMLSRGFAGLHGSTIVVNLPGSVAAVRLYLRVLAPVMSHAVQMMRGEGH